MSLRGKESIKKTFDVSYRTADRYYKTFKEPDHFQCSEASFRDLPFVCDSCFCRASNKE